MAVLYCQDDIRCNSNVTVAGKVPPGELVSGSIPKRNPGLVFWCHSLMRAINLKSTYSPIAVNRVHSNAQSNTEYLISIVI